MISFLAGVIDLVVALLARCFSTSARVCGLPVRNVRIHEGSISSPLLRRWMFG